MTSAAEIGTLADMARPSTEKDYGSILEYAIALMLAGIGVVIVGILILVVLTRQLEAKVGVAQKAAEEARKAEIGARSALAALQAAQPSPTTPAPARPSTNPPPAAPRPP